MAAPHHNRTTIRAAFSVRELCAARMAETRQAVLHRLSEELRGTGRKTFFIRASTLKTGCILMPVRDVRQCAVQAGTSRLNRAPCLPYSRPSAASRPLLRKPPDRWCYLVLFGVIRRYLVLTFFCFARSESVSQLQALENSRATKAILPDRL